MATKISLILQTLSTYWVPVTRDARVIDHTVALTRAGALRCPLSHNASPGPRSTMPSGSSELPPGTLRLGLLLPLPSASCYQAACLLTPLDRNSVEGSSHI